MITSRRHAVVKELAEIRDDRDSPLMFLEGPRLIQEILNSGRPIEALVWTALAEKEPVFARAHSGAKQKIQVSESVFEALSDVKSPQGILATARIPQWSWNDVAGGSPRPIVILDGLQDPGNVATIVRTAEAAGASGVVTTPNTARLFSPKALRGAMGSTLRLPCLEHLSLSEITTELKRNAYVVRAAAMQGAGQSIPYTQADWKKPAAIIFGQEGNGISAEWSSYIDETLFIPMQPPIESLNVAASAAIILYEALRQRGKIA